MCGAYAAINNPFVGQLTEMLGVPEIESRDIRVPASDIQIIYENKHGRQLSNAKWWLMLDTNGKPNYQYATFNSRSDKLFSSRLTKGLFKTSRCIIPASGFIEGQDKKYHFIESAKSALALGGICKHYLISDEIITAASIITCPGSNPKFENIHRKSIPLMLDYRDESLINGWLDNTVTHPEAFIGLLGNDIKVDLLATPIASARNLKATDQVIEIKSDS